MTKEKSDALIGRLTVEYTKAREQVNLHETALREKVQNVASLATLLRQGNADSILRLMDEIDFDDVREIAENLRMARGRYEELKDKLRDCGVVL